MLYTPVFRAIITNMTILRIQHQMSHECGVMLNAAPPFPRDQNDIPLAMTPTKLQTSTPHPFWIDIMPSGAMRDNLIMAVQDPSFDEEDFGRDVVGGLCEGVCDGEMAGILVWSDPWSPTGVS